MYNEAGNGIKAHVHVPTKESTHRRAGTHVVSTTKGAYSMTPLDQDGAMYDISVVIGRGSGASTYTFVFTAPGPTDVVSGGVITMDLHTTY